ncbi:MAG TPA: BadF/BadG/BcrA/BcrD ATPase family protein [Terriglobales bacterium]|nr:BadF/BadG/BcrA/BcrD ATPase family protein [Terriglobales bacterium]
MAIFLGVDAGGSKTTCAVGDDTSTLATATSGGSNVTRCGEGAARIELQEAMQAACVAARIRLADVSRICIGMAGAARPVTSAVIRDIVAEIYSGELEIVGDMVIAMQAAFGDRPGAIVIAGTGSIAYGRNSRGETARAGGWGYEISDEGSGHWIGRAAISAVMRAEDLDEAAPTGLALSILRAWHLNSLDDLVRAANASPPADFSSLFPHVLAAADAGDPVARTVLTQAGTELAALAKIVITRVLEDEPTIPVGMSGGVFRSSSLVRNVFYNSVRSEYPNAAIGGGIIEPVKGALELARKGAARY